MFEENIATHVNDQMSGPDPSAASKLARQQPDPGEPPKCGPCLDKPRYGGSNEIKQWCVERACIRHQKTREATGRSRQSAASPSISRREQGQAVARTGRLVPRREGTAASRTEHRPPQHIQQEEGTGRPNGPKGEPESLLPARKWEEGSGSRGKGRLANVPGGQASKTRGTLDP